jgi:serine/threonine protein kinase
MGGHPSSELSEPPPNGNQKESLASERKYCKHKTFDDLVNHDDVQALYAKGKELGSGNMATVYQYTHKLTGKKFAAKVVLKQTLEKLSDYTNELEILAHLKGHPHILELEVSFCFIWLFCMLARDLHNLRLVMDTRS